MPTPPVAPGHARRAAVGVFIVFAASGFTFANWASRIPTVQRLLELRPEQMGLILLMGSVGSVLAMPVAGRVLGWIGGARTVLCAALLAGLGLAVAVAAAAAGLPGLLAAGLFAAMMGMGTWDVAMNFAGTQVEQAMGRSIMPWFHGCFSLGTVAGAATGTALSRGGIPVTTHLWAALVLMVVAVLVGISLFLPHAPAPAEEAGRSGPTSFMGAWAEPRTLLIGLVVLAAALTEGAANDWLALGVRDGFDVPEHVGAMAFTVFTVAMTVMRFAGTWLLDRFGRVAVLRLCTALAIGGLALYGLGPSMPIALAGVVLWGFGAALGFPIGMSAASDDPLRAAARLSVVSTVGYGAFLVGPPLLGLLAGHVGYRHAMLAILVPLVAGLLAVGATAPPRRPDEGEAPGGPGQGVAGPGGRGQ